MLAWLRELSRQLSTQDGFHCHLMPYRVSSQGCLQPGCMQCGQELLPLGINANELMMQSDNPICSNVVWHCSDYSIRKIDYFTCVLIAAR